ncbi:MAG: septum formation initiator [Flavobacteriaceae bacterium]|nr:septum formation initiator family protein [Bacteroidia bacterium]NND09991.1 septum formation initiator [Flavobacteriaceae bacterium]NNK28556.1 septum formation initiator [Flavobacteriaceae bacterium]NNL61799.1 septum formation initiator [Flavobacteriaceae bacterium]RZV57587.1 MAG: septum formation initiator [Flavobacteriaceae bacterium]
MNWNELKDHKLIKPFRNVFGLGLLAFIIWMLFFDSNSLLSHMELNAEKDKANKQKEHYQKGIEVDAKEIEKLETEEGVEKFAREEYYMKKEKEEIYIIEYEDSIPKDKDDD